MPIVEIGIASLHHQLFLAHFVLSPAPNISLLFPNYLTKVRKMDDKDPYKS